MEPSKLLQVLLKWRRAGFRAKNYHVMSAYADCFNELLRLMGDDGTLRDKVTQLSASVAPKSATSPRAGDKPA